MAPHDQHSVVTGWDGVETRIPGLSGFCVVAMLSIHAVLQPRSNICRPYGTLIAFRNPPQR